jgi:hypothetical protein
VNIIMVENESDGKKSREGLEESQSTEVNVNEIRSEINFLRKDVAACLDEVQRQRESLERMRNDLTGINEASRTILANQKNAAGMAFDRKGTSYDQLKTINQANEEIRKNEALFKTVLEKISRELLEEERILKEYSSLDKKYKSMNKKYDGMVNSRLGKLTMRIWAVYNKIRNT